MNSPVHGAISVTTPGHQYDIVIGRGLLSDATVWQDLPKASHAVIVTNPTVGALYTTALQQALVCHANHAGINDMVAVVIAVFLAVEAQHIIESKFGTQHRGHLPWYYPHALRAHQPQVAGGNAR